MYSRRSAFSPAVHEALKERGHQIRSYDMNSGLHGIQRLSIHGQQFWFGGADPRREGVAKGD
jgi:gamma-glutamyltranspeptidase/glutathione hydrolase